MSKRISAHPESHHDPFAQADGTDISRMEWFKRKFCFDLPIEMYPNVIERVRGTSAPLEE